MTFNELIDRARDRTITRIQESITDKRKSSEVHIEPAMRDRDGNIVSAPDGLKLPLRWDYFAESAPEEKNADSITLKLAEPLYAEWQNGMRIKIISVCWDCMIFRLAPAQGDSDWSWLSSWFLEWFDPEDLNPEGEAGLYEVVHFISDPEIHDSSVRFIVDFGSAKTASLTSLLDLAAQLGFSSCEIGEKEQPQISSAINSTVN